MHRAEDISGVGLDGLLVGEPDQGLRREVENEIGSRRFDRGANGGEVANVADAVMQPTRQTKLVEDRRLARRRQRETSDLGTEREQPFGQPRALEAGVSGEENSFASVSIGEGHDSSAAQQPYQTFHGALPSDQILFKCWDSWKVSIGCQ